MDLVAWLYSPVMVLIALAVIVLMLLGAFLLVGLLGAVSFGVVDARRRRREREEAEADAEDDPSSDSPDAEALDISSL